VNTSELEAAARVAGQEILPLNVSHESEFDAAFATLIQRGAGDTIPARLSLDFHDAR
jgi:hypothetical protein